jgi:hypothetical protein
MAMTASQGPKGTIKSVASVYAVLAGAVVLLHLGFVVFAAGGGLLALRWPRAAWVHVPAASWAAFIEFSGGICPLTPLEGALRARAGLDHYEGDFVARYLFPMLYPEGLDRNVQVALGVAVVALNVGLYSFVYISRGSRRR